MFPVLFSFGNIVVYSASIVMVIGFFISLFYFWKMSRVEIIEEEKIFDFVLAILFGALLSGRLIYIFEHAADFQGFFDRAIHLYKYPGLNFWGLMFGGLFSGFAYSIKNKLVKSSILDYFASSFALFCAFLFLGYFVNGLYAGQVNETLGVSFVGLSGKRIPWQILAIAIFYVFFIFSKKKLQSQTFQKLKKEEQGFVFWLFMTIFFAVFLLLEFIRRDTLYFEGVVLNRFLYFVIFLVSSVILVSRYKFLEIVKINLMARILKKISEKK